MKGKKPGLITLAVLTLAFTIWCFVDGTYYLGAFGLFILALQVYNYITIKKKK